MTPKIAIWAPSHKLCPAMSSQLRHVSTIGKKLFKQQYVLHMSLEYGELWHTSSCYRLLSLGHPCKFQRVWRLRIVTPRHSSIGRQPNFAALNRGRRLYSAGRPSRCVLAHISSGFYITLLTSAKRLCNRGCLSVSNLGKKNLRTDLHNIYREGWRWASEQMVELWWRCG